jgi:hypothetical protein
MSSRNRTLPLVRMVTGRRPKGAGLRGLRNGGSWVAWVRRLATMGLERRKR